MPNNGMTAAELVVMVRGLINEKGSQIPYRDGFAADASHDNESKSILQAINNVKNKMAITGYAREYYTFTMNSPDYEYDLPTRMFRVLSVVLSIGENVYPIREADYRYLDYLRPRFRAQVPTLPIEYYMIGNKIGFNPGPNLDYDAQVHAVITEEDYTAESSISTLLPAYYHPGIGYGAAAELQISEVENPAAQARVPLLTDRANAYFMELQALARTQGVEPLPETRPADIGQAVRR